jgi:hypothetical protein
LSLEEKAIALSVLLLENVSGLRRRLRKKLENGTRRTRVLTSNSWFERKDGEENAGTHNNVKLNLSTRTIVRYC